MKKLNILLILLFFIVGCVPKHYATYDLGLQEVERPSNTKERYGEPKIVRFQEEGKTKFSFEDGMIKIILFPASTQFALLLTNKTSHSIKVIWDEAVYVDESGMSQRVMHSGVKYIDKNNSQPPTIVVRGATISDVVLPTDNIYYEKGKYGGWRESPLLPDMSYDRPEIERQASGLIGKTVQILLPIKIEDVVNEYVFVFSIDGFSIETKQ
jgi:hypothetical protein